MKTYRIIHKNTNRTVRIINIEGGIRGLKSIPQRFLNGEFKVTPLRWSRR